MNSLTLMAIALCVFVLAYRYYGAFLAAKIAVLDRKKVTPAHTLRDGKDYDPTNRWVLFGHHFAAIAGAGPLVGPVLAAQYGYLPGALWILIGAVFAGGVQDYIVLYASVRNRGQSISNIAHRYLGKVAGWCTAFAVLFIIIVALAGLAMVVVNALAESSWAFFTIAATIPIAFLMGQWMYNIRPGKIAEASVIGVVLLLAGVVLGGAISHSSYAAMLQFSPHSLKIMLPIYGFIAAVLPVWMLLCPRDYLSTYMKLGTIALLTIGIFFVHPSLHIPALTRYIHGGGPIVPGPVWPYVFLTIACGAISGFHALIGSGTTPKMIENERDILPIGYGAMLAEGFVGMLALVAACTLSYDHYFAINARVGTYHISSLVASQMAALAHEMGEQTLIGRTGGSVTLAVGMASVFKALPGMKDLVAYWYHFAIMFEALFILTTVDAGTRVARFILQEMLRPAYKPFADGKWLPGVLITSAVVTYSWYYLLKGGSISTIWPIFGIANQLLAVIALAVGTTYIMRHASRQVYALSTFLPGLYLAVTVFASGVMYTEQLLFAPYIPTDNWVKIILTIVMMILAAIICITCAKRWLAMLRAPESVAEEEPEEDLMELAAGTDIE